MNIAECYLYGIKNLNKIRSLLAFD